MLVGVAGDGASLEAALVDGERGGSALGRVGAGSLESAASLAAPDRAGGRGARSCAARERTGWGPRLIAGEIGVAHSTVHAILKRHGRSRAPRARRAKRFGATSGRARAICCTWTSSATRASGAPGTRSPAIAARRACNATNALGHDYFHAVVDDHSRLVYGELLADEKAATVTAFTERALAWFAAPRHHGPPA